MTSSFNWKPERVEGVWRYGLPCLRPLVASTPWLTVLILLVMFHVIGGTLVSEKGTLFDLPDGSLKDGEATGSVALIVRVAHDTLVFFDDSRYMLSDPASSAALADHLSEIISRARSKTLLVLADRTISAGDLMRFAALARQSGVGKVLFAEKKPEAED